MTEDTFVPNRRVITKNRVESVITHDRVARPARMIIHGDNATLESLLEEFAGHWKVSARNVANYREIWDMYLPKYDEKKPEHHLNKDWCVTYNPIITVRKCYPSNARSASIDELPYFIIILNAARDLRPKEEKKVESKGKDPLQENLIDRGMIIAEFDDFYLTPNGYPYHPYASLLIAKDEKREQKYPAPHEIESWMRFSILMKQYVFFNAPYAGASVYNRLHAQVVDPEGIRYENKVAPYPILQKHIMKRISVKDGIDILRGYGIEVLSLKGRDAPYRASHAVKKLRDDGHWYNIMVNGKEVLIVARNAEKETSKCIGKKCGAYEMSGVVLVGNVEEKLLEQIDLDRVVYGAEIFSQLNYEQIASNISNATIGLGGLERSL